jgi:pimeloyl-ACP methyl ester carboxylesterase
MPSFSVQQAQVTGSSAQQSTTAQNGAPVAGRGRGRRSAPVPPEPPGYQHIKVTSTVDGTEQDSVLVIPTKGASSEPRPIVVFLHAWSVDDRQRQPGLEAEAEKRDWLLLIPNFRGHYDHPKACGSKYARQDILDAVEWVKKHYAVDEKRVYLLGYSGGGFMTMLMGSLYPQVWAAASSWSGISDLTAWYHQDEDPAVPFARRYTDNMKACFGGAPTESAQLAADYRDRSPISHLRPELGLPFDLNAGSHDEIVSNEQTLNAFRILAPGILSGKDATDLQDTATPIAGSIRTDPLTKRQIYLRNEAHNVSVTIFDGGHEMLPEAAFAWFDQFARP